MTEYQGSCHCGAVSFSFSMPPIGNAMRCDCSICKRKGMIMSTELVAPDDIEIRAGEGSMSVYTFATHAARHHFCNRCGIHVFVETRLNPGCYRINLGCVEGIDAFGLPCSVYDGKSL